MPKALYLEQTERYWHETMGLVWQSLRDWLDTSSDPVEEPIVLPAASSLVDENSAASAAQPQ